MISSSAVVHSLRSGPLRLPAASGAGTSDMDIALCPCSTEKPTGPGGDAADASTLPTAAAPPRGRQHAELCHARQFDREGHHRRRRGPRAGGLGVGVHVGGRLRQRAIGPGALPRARLAARVGQERGEQLARVHCHRLLHVELLHIERARRSTHAAPMVEVRRGHGNASRLLAARDLLEHGERLRL
eukprot:scaffold86833_cov27-Phaeocystis_antarctica.AAC.1